MPARLVFGHPRCQSVDVAVMSAATGGSFGPRAGELHLRLEPKRVAILFETLSDEADDWAVSSEENPRTRPTRNKHGL